MGAVRLAGFFLGAVGLELARGVGAVALVLALLVGCLGLRSGWLVLVVAGGVAASVALPETGNGAGKVAHGLSNLPFLLLLYVAVVLAGFLAGRLVRAVLRRTRVP